MGEIRVPHNLYDDFFPDEKPKPISHEERKKRTNGFSISKAIAKVPMLLSLRSYWPFHRIFPQEIAGPSSSSSLSSTARRAVKIASERDRGNSCVLGVLSHNRLLNIFGHLKAKGKKNRSNEPKKVANTPGHRGSCWKPEKGMRKTVEFLTMEKKRKKKEDRDTIRRRKIAGPSCSSSLSSTARRAVKIASEKDRGNSCVFGVLSHNRLLNILGHLKAKGKKNRSNEPKKVATTPGHRGSCWKPEKGMRKAVEFLTMEKKRKKKEDREAIWRRPVMRGRRCRDLRNELPPYEKEEGRTVVGAASAASTQARVSNWEEEEIVDYWSCLNTGFMDKVEGDEEDSLFSIELGLGGKLEKRSFSS
ncbi:hypothetical protein HPP92_011863 [Vanilla planifolia]|uniref:Uncharacterized protein n=1 Tax=Vanilla planifolia TaxID=51239 RepID=A0A835R3R4_VANPL|nr:hypothetical protein HPP92_011863 [Vanilla planifolia]